MKLSIIIPVYNEEQTIHEVLERVAAVNLGAIEKEIVIANDGSTARSTWATAQVEPLLASGVGPVRAPTTGLATARTRATATSSHHRERREPDEPR